MPSSAHEHTQGQEGGDRPVQQGGPRDDRPRRRDDPPHARLPRGLRGHRGGPPVQGGQRQHGQCFG